MEVSGMLESGESFYNRQEYLNALEIFSQAKRLSPRDNAIRIWLSIVLQAIGKIQEANKELQEASEIEPENASVYFYRGVLSESQHNDSTAKAFFQKTVELTDAEKGNSESQRLQILALVHLDGLNKSYTQALQRLQESHLLYPEEKEFLSLQGGILLAQQRNKEALDILRHAYNAGERSSSVLQNLGVAHERLGLGEEAMEFYFQSLKMNVHSVLLYRNLLRYYFRKFRWREFISLVAWKIKVEDAYKTTKLAYLDSTGQS